MAPADEVRRRILDAALELLVDGGREAVSTRAVTSAAGVQAPTLYRIFGDKHGLLDAVAVHGFETHLAGWHGWQPGAEPIDAIRQGWDMHVQWGVHNPSLYSIAYGDARPGISSPAATSIDSILRTLVEQAANAGLLRLPVTEAVHVLRAIGAGVVFTLIALPEADRDPRLSTRGREAALSTIMADRAVPPTDGRAAMAMQLRMNLGEATELTQHERALLGDWLDRVAAG